MAIKNAAGRTDWGAYEACTTRFCPAEAGEGCRDLRKSYHPGFNRMPERKEPHRGRPVVENRRRRR